MVSRLALLRILHCKLNKKRKALLSTNSDSSHSTIGTKKPTIKKEINVSDDAQHICRVCLKEGDIPIYGNGENEDFSDTLSSFCGIFISILDSHPKHLCQSCHALLQGAILLKKTAQQSDGLLKNTHENSSDNEQYFQTDYLECNENEPEQISNYHCKKCTLDFDTFKQYTEHRLSQEHENMRQTCPYCKKSYAQLYFKRHLSIHKLDPPYAYMCDVCGKKFRIKGQLTRHRMTHFLELPFKCSLCPYRGRFTESLKLHMRTHTGEKPYQCSECPKRFVNKSNLNKHILTHKGDHDFKCESCDRAFNTKRNLELHFKVDHTGIKEHMCGQCGKAFGYRKQMMKHQLKVHKRAKLRTGRTPLYLQLQSKEVELKRRAD